jgi:hypothetical protein
VKFIYPSKHELSQTPNNELQQHYHILLQTRDIMQALLDDEVELADAVLFPSKYKEQHRKLTEELEMIEEVIHSVQNQITLRKNAKQWQATFWQMPLEVKSTAAESLLLGADRVGFDPHEMLRGLIWHFNDDLQTKLQYEVPQRDPETDGEWEAPIFKSLKLQAIIELNQPSQSLRQKRQLYCWRTSTSWEELDIQLRREDWLDNTTQKKTSRR